MDDRAAENVDCVSCGGTGMRKLEMCESCDGIGVVQVASPALPCPRCNGTGQSQSEATYRVLGCVVCRGTGWALLLVDESLPTKAFRRGSVENSLPKKSFDLS